MEYVFSKNGLARFKNKTTPTMNVDVGIRDRCFRAKAAARGKQGRKRDIASGTAAPKPPFPQATYNNQPDRPMTEPLQYQLRVYLDEAQRERARIDPQSDLLGPLPAILSRYNATMVCQLDAFEAYIAEAEARGTSDDPLYKWTKVTVQDPAMRAKHSEAFAIRVDGNEVYAKDIADALENELRPIEGGAVVKRMTRHDTDPAKNIPIPSKYR